MEALREAPPYGSGRGAHNLLFVSLLFGVRPSASARALTRQRPWILRSARKVSGCEILGFRDADFGVSRPPLQINAGVFLAPTVFWQLLTKERHEPPPQNYEN